MTLYTPLFKKEEISKILKFAKPKDVQQLIYRKEKYGPGKKFFRKFAELRKKCIPDNVINLFYENPKNFFSKHEKLLKETCFYDSAGFSIFDHYFNILYQQFKINNKIYTDIDIKIDMDFAYYESNFDKFFKENKKYLLIQDMHLETPLHKIAKLENKNFFLEIYEKLKKIKCISTELITIKDLYNKSCFQYILEEIKYKPHKIQNNEIYYNFIKDNFSILESLPKKDSILLNKYLNKIIFEIKPYKKEFFDEICNNINYFINNNKNLNLFSYLYCPLSDINYINLLFEICSTNEHYENIFQIVSSLSKRKEAKTIEKYIFNHISFVLRKINLYIYKGEKEFNYVIKLIKDVLANILNKKTKSQIERILCHKKRFKKGLINNISYNVNLNFDQKIELYDLFSQITKQISDECIDKEYQKYYKFFKFYKYSKIDENNIMKNDAEYTPYLKAILEENILARTIIEIDIDTFYQKYSNSLTERIPTIKEFINKYKVNILKNFYNLSDEKIEILLKLFITFEYKFKIMNDNEKNNSFLKDLDSKFKYKNKEYLDIFKKKYILSNKEVTESRLKYCLEKGLDEYDNFFDLLFHSAYDFSDLLFNKLSNIVKELIDIKIINNQNEEIGKENKKNFKIKSTKTDFLQLFQKKITLLKGKSFEDKYYSFLILISIQLKNIDILLPKHKNRGFTEKMIKQFYKKYQLKLIKFWENLDYSEVVKDIQEIILPICVIFYKRGKMLEVIIKEFDSNFNFDVYTKALDDVIKYCDKNKIQDAIFEESFLEIINDFIYILNLLFIKKNMKKNIHI